MRGKQQGQCRQTAWPGQAFGGHDIRETSMIPSDNPIGAGGTGNGDGWRGKAREEQSETSAEEERDMEECSYRSKPETP